MYSPILCDAYETVMASYNGDASLAKSSAYQSEDALEQNFIDILLSQGYERLLIHTEAELMANLRRQLARLNESVLKRSDFTDGEWNRLVHDEICRPGDGIIEKSKRLQDGGAGFSGGVVSLMLDDGRSVNIRLIDKKNLHVNRLQVLNQYVPSGGIHANRYDVTVLCNGIPVVHIELKRRGVNLKTAYYQIDRYQRDSFWSGCGLYEYVQVFVISNGTHTKYYANTLRERSVHEHEGFEMTSWWADANNKRISDLVDFAKTFFARRTLLNILTKYCVLGTDGVMRVMRPYQIAACEAVIGKVNWSIDNNIEGCIDAGGYIWHTTGSGKTLTSFKCARLLSNHEAVDKVLFVVDRKDLDAQTVREYDTFEKGAANASSSTKQLESRLKDPASKIVVTTIHKLGRLLKSGVSLPVYGQKVVFIFDECHRSQFGEMHESIVRKFKRYHMFGFTGTPIFTVNMSTASSPLTVKGSDGVRHLSSHGLVLKTTQQAFGERLHSYTIVDAINDGNVLPFRVDYLKTVGAVDDIVDEQVEDIDVKSALRDNRRVEDICRYIAAHYGRKTNDGRYNSMLCCDDIPSARAYYQMMVDLSAKGEFRYRRSNGVESDLRFAVVFSYAANGEAYDGAMRDESLDASFLPQSDREFLDMAIARYNTMFPGEMLSFDTGVNFEGYYLDVGRRLKNGQIDILIVVNMMLTGFDSKRLGCLWVDKYLHAHGLVQAFSRTNRVYDRQKSYGNIVCFRALQQEVDDAIALFGNEHACGIVTLKTYDEYYDGYMDDDGKVVKGYRQIVEELMSDFPVSKLQAGLAHSEEKDFVSRFGTVLSLRNILRSFDEFSGNEIFTEMEFQDYTSHYLDAYDEITRHVANERVNVNADLVFDIQLIDRSDINVDYILMLVSKYADTMCQDADILVKIRKTMDSSPQLRSKKALIEAFLALISEGSDVDWHAFIRNRAVSDLDAIVVAEGLSRDNTFEFMRGALMVGEVRGYGSDFDAMIGRMSRRGGRKEAKKQAVHAKLQEWFNQYFDAVDVDVLMI